MNDNLFRGIAHGFGPGGGAPCSVTPRGQGLEVNDDAGNICNVLLPYVGMTVGLTGMDDAYIVFESKHDGKSVKVLVSDKNIVRQIEAIGAPRSIIDALQGVMSKKAKRSLGRASVFAIFLFVVVGLVIGGWALVGFAAQKAVDYIPPDWEKSLGRSAAEGILQENKVCSDPELIAAITEIGTRLVGGLGKNNFSFKVRIVDTDDVNAFALPGGYVFINRGLIEQADDSFEVAGVLAHEIQHVMLHHGIENVAREAGAMLLLQALVGDMGGLEQFLLYNAASLASMSFNRDQEREADRTGLDLMYKAGMDPTGLLRFLKKLSEKEGAMSGAFSILSTHPASAERVAELNAIIEKKSDYEVIPLTRDIKNMEIICGPVSLTDPDGDF